MIAEENRLRHEALHALEYDAVCGDSRSRWRVEVANSGEHFHVPRSMTEDPDYSSAMGRHEFEMLRFRHDFEFWCAKCVRITDKITMEEIPFRLNRPQRDLVEILEGQRRMGQPMRVIMLKARQWGGSTVVQVYFAWIQIIHRRNWNSLICAHVKDASSNIRGMYSRLLEHYPQEYWEEECKPEFRPYERMTNIRYIPGRGCRVTVSSSESQESARGLDCALVHLSEVAFWKDSVLHNPADLIRSVASGVARKELSCVVMESTANGVGNFFHREWLRACSPGKSDKTPFFVPWHHIPIYSEPVADAGALWDSMDDYERALWEKHGCSLEAINWYRMKRREFDDHRAMMAEFPTTPEEAFCSTSFNVFAADDVERMRGEGADMGHERGEVTGNEGDMPGDISSPRFVASPQGLARVWLHPRPGGEYIVAVDIGGRSRTADWSVITVLDRHMDTDGRPEVVASWRGHIDHDLLAWRAAAMGAWYNDALLVVESNTWEASSEGRGRYILDMLAESYPNLYFRREPGAADGPGRPGFHTNSRTKPALIAHLIALVREGGYIEHDGDALDELLHYEALPDGSYAARRGCHDDMLMSRAIALWVHSEEPREAVSIDVKALLRYAGA